MSKDPAFLFYPNDYIGGTMGMTFEEKGAYVDLLMLQFNRGHMTYRMIGQVIGHLELTSQTIILTKFKIDTEGLYYNERLEIEIENRKNYVLSRNNNPSGMNQYSKKTGRTTSSTTTHTTGRAEDVDENVNESTNVDSSAKNENDKNPEIKQQSEDYITPILFTKFWDIYPKKINKGYAQTRWDKLCNEKKEKRLLWPEVRTAVLRQKKTEQWLDENGQYTPHPATWLNNKGWLNDPKEMKSFKRNGKPVKQNKNELTDKENDEIDALLENKITPQCLADNLKMIKKTFPTVSTAFLEILKDRFKDNKFTDARITNAVKGVIDTCNYSTPTIASFIQFDKDNPVRKMQDGEWFNKGDDGIYRNTAGRRLIE